MSMREWGLPTGEVQYAGLTEAWRADVPLDAKLLFLTPFGDSFFSDSDGVVWNLDLALAQIHQAAGSEAEFLELLGDSIQRDQWLMPNLLDELEAKGIILAAGQCFGFVEPPFVGGAFSVDNLAPIALQEYYDLVAQLREVDLS